MPATPDLPSHDAGKHAGASYGSTHHFNCVNGEAAGAEMPVPRRHNAARRAELNAGRNVLYVVLNDGRIESRKEISGLKTPKHQFRKLCGPRLCEVRDRVRIDQIRDQQNSPGSRSEAEQSDQMPATIIVDDLARRPGLPLCRRHSTGRGRCAWNSRCSRRVRVSAVRGKDPGDRPAA